MSALPPPEDGVLTTVGDADGAIYSLLVDPPRRLKTLAAHKSVVHTVLAKPGVGPGRFGCSLFAQGVSVYFHRRLDEATVARLRELA